MAHDTERAAATWLRAYDALADARAAEQAARAALLALTGEGRAFKGHGVRVAWAERPGAVAWTRLVETLGIPARVVDAHRGEPTVSARVEPVRVRPEAGWRGVRAALARVAGQGGAA